MLIFDSAKLKTNTNVYLSPKNGSRGGARRGAQRRGAEGCPDHRSPSEGQARTLSPLVTG